jgi:hypothetical protein
MADVLMMRTRLGFGVLLIVVPLLCLAAGAARAQTGEAEALRQEVEDLKRTIDHLNGRVEGLEHQLADRPEANARAAAGAPTPSPEARAAAPEAKPQERWHGLANGMTVQQVEMLLGRPDRTFDLSPKKVWYYTYADIGSGSVVFADDGTVTDWQPPPFNTWW